MPAGHRTKGSYNYWISSLRTGSASREQVLIGMTESAESKAMTISVIPDGIEYQS